MVDTHIKESGLQQGARISRNSRDVLIRSLLWLYWWGWGLALLVTLYVVIQYFRAPGLFLGETWVWFGAGLLIFAAGFSYFRHRAANAYRDPTSLEPAFIGVTLLGATILIASVQHPLVFTFAVCATPVMARLRQRRAVAITLIWTIINVLIVVYVWERPQIWYLAVGIAGFQVTALLFAANLMREWRSVERLSRLNRDLGSTRELLRSIAAAYEKARIAREIHDVSGHKLTAAKLKLELLEENTADGHQKEQIAGVKTLVVELMKDLRHLVLESGEGPAIDLAESIRILTDSLPPKLCQLDVENVRGLTSEQAQTLLRVAQEGITNALRHAHATSLSISLDRVGEAVVLKIEDDGVGFDPAGTGGKGGVGLRGMAERIETLNGTFEIDTRADEGTAVTATLPLGQNYAP